MDPALIIFGLGVGTLVGMTGMGGGSLMTPLLILVIGVEPITAIGTDIFYSAVTKTVGGWRHFTMRTAYVRLSLWLAAGSVPAAVAGVWVIELLQRRYGSDFDGVVLGILGSTLLVVGVVTLIRALFLSSLIREREGFHLDRRHKVAAVGIGVLTGFVIGLTSAGSGTLIAIMLIVVFRLAPRQVVGTDVFHAALLLWAAGVAHWIGGNVDFGIAGTILLGSVPGVILGSQLSARAPQGFLRLALGVVLVASGIALVTKGDPGVVPAAVSVAAIGLVGFLVAEEVARRARRAAQEASAPEPEPLAGEPAAAEDGKLDGERDSVRAGRGSSS
jgi:uncharacterized protein